MAKKKKFFNSNNFKRAGTVAAGMVGAKLVNSVLVKVPFINNFVSGSGKLSQLVLPGVKVGAGAYMMSSRDQMYKDLGVGVAGVGVVEGVQALIPSVNLSGLGAIDDMEFLSGTVDINLDELGGHQTDRYLEDYMEIAGHHSDAYLYDEQQVSGMEFYPGDELYMAGY